MVVQNSGMEGKIEELGPALLEAFKGVPDPRKPRGRRHPYRPACPWPPAPCSAPMSRGYSLYAMAQWGREHWGLAQTLGFTPGQTPCVATLHLVFRRLDKATFEAALGDWAQATLGDSREAIPIDGKSLRGIHGGELPGVHLVAAYAQGAGLVLAQGDREQGRRIDGSPRTTGPTRA